MRDTSTTDTTCREIDAEIVRLAGQQGALDDEIGRWLLIAARAGVHRRLGMGSFAEYVERRLGSSPRVTKERLRVAKALEQLPKLHGLLRSGERSFSMVREIARVADVKTEDVWIAHTEGKTVREVERLVAGRKKGDRPNGERDPLLARRRLVLEFSGDAFATVVEAMDRIRKMIGPHASHAETIHAMAEGVLGKGRSEEQAAYQVAVTLCAGCERTWRHAGGEAIEVSDAVRGCACCDGELGGLTEIEPAEVEAPDASTHVDPAPTPVEPSEELRLDTAERTIRDLVRRGGIRAVLRETSNALGMTLETLSPKLRGLVLARDGYRCSVPGCRNDLFIHLHHLEPERRGGPNNPENIVAICSVHHHLHHEGYLAIEGRPSTGLVFRHADGTLYGRPLGQKQREPEPAAA